LDDSDVVKLQDTKIEFNDEDNIDVKEELVFSALGVRTSVFDKEFDEDIYLTIESEDGIMYKYNFEDDVDRTLVSKDEPLNINFLGKDLEIVDVNSDSFTVIEGEEVLLKESEEKVLNIDGEEVKLKLVSVSDSTDKIAVEINGELESGLSEGDVEEVGNSGFEVYVKTVLSNEAGEGEDIAELRIAKDVEKEYEDGDEVVEDDERFVYRIAMKAGTDNIDYFGVSYAEVSDDLDDEFKPLKAGEKLVFPNDFVSISMKLADVDYKDFDFKFVEKDNVNSIRIDAEDDEGIVIGSDKVDRIFFNSSHVIYDDDNGDEQVALLSAVKLKNDDIELPLAFDGANFSVGSDIEFVVDGTMSFLGATEEEAEAADIKYDGSNYGSQDESVVCENGIVIVSPEDNAEADKIKLQVPDEDLEASILVE
jgi:hypothetical protein